MEEMLAAGIHWVTLLLELAGIIVIVIGAAAGLILYLRQLGSSPTRADAFSNLRSNLGRAILLGLEFLVAADIVNTVAVDPTLDNLAVLAGIVLVRTFLSFSLEVELEGHWPWQRSARTKAPD